MSWLYSPSDPLVQTLAACLVVFIGVLVVTRLIGLRSFAKFTAYDFAITIAIGSILSAILTSSTSVVHGFIAILGLMSISYLFSAIQKRSETIDKLSSNNPILLMRDGEMLEGNMKKAQIQEAQLIAKLREANVLRFSQVIAVVLESTGDISVLHEQGDEDVKFEERLLDGVVT